MLLPRLGVVGSFAFQGTGFQGFRLISSVAQKTLGTINMSASSATDEQRQKQQQRTKIVAGMQELCDKYDGFILDQFGVLHGTLFSLFCTISESLRGIA